ncbi:hypothetical protein [Ectopseudomonas khazarica]|uniref:hypothetical protein n=1 Tax=Ectopseudomonas khazarica TaxID=2502979 RepID=UPI0037C74BF8
MSATYKALWNDIFSNGFTGDFVSSISFDALNHTLSAHHTNPKDRNRYKYKISKPLTSQKPQRNFELVIDLTKPLSVIHEPNPEAFKVSNGWAELPGPFPLDGSGVTKESEPPRPNIRVRIPSIVLQLKWPKAGTSGDHIWNPTGLSAELAAYISIVRDGGRVSLFIVPTMISFTYTHIIPAIENALAKDPALQECESKFNDLLLIGLNEFSVELLPKLVQTIELPSIEVTSMALHPTFLHVAPMHVSVGASLDSNERIEKVAERFSTTLGALEYALERDVQDAGGINALIVDSVESASTGEISFHSEAVIDQQLTRVNQILSELRKSITEINIDVAPSPMTAGIREGIGIGFNEYLATTIANESLPPGQSQCSKEERILDVVKGRVCHWSRISDAKIKFSGATINASVDVDLGGKIVACVKKFWDCSWRWACEDMGLSFVGRPAISIRLLSDGGGVRFACSVNLGGLKPVAKLPWPFNKVVEFFFSIIIKFIEAILNLIALSMSFVVIPVRVTLPGQSTVVTFSAFTGFPYSLPGASDGRTTFIGHTATISAS